MKKNFENRQKISFLSIDKGNLKAYNESVSIHILLYKNKRKR